MGQDHRSSFSPEEVLTDSLTSNSFPGPNMLMALIAASKTEIQCIPISENATESVVSIYSEADRNVWEILSGLNSAAVV